MRRFALEYLEKWLGSTSRKPLVVRGARQVGKSFLVRDFCKRQKIACLEINFERTPEDKKIFESKDVKKIRSLLELRFEHSFREGIPSLLFLDEIQSAPEVFVNLRYLYEDWPEQPIIAAGSLLDFALSEMDYSVPVGRIEYLFMGPLSFEEFLIAQGKETLRTFLLEYKFPDPIPEWIHTQLLEQMKLFSFLGGMPEVVHTYVTSQDLLSCDRIQKTLLLTYEDDFNKYRKRVPFERLSLLFRAAPAEVGRKFVYSRVAPEERADAMAKALDLLAKANVIKKIFYSAGNGVPLAAEQNSRNFKILFVDVGLLRSALGIQMMDLNRHLNLVHIHEGSVAEQLIGQELLYLRPFYQMPELFYWAREKPGSMAEVDYLITHGTKVVPIEVKAGKSGKLKSLRFFLSEKKVEAGVRFSTEPPSNEGGLIHLPLYLVNQLQRILSQS